MKKLIYISAISFLLINLSSCYTNRTISSQEEYQKCMKKKNNQYLVDERNNVYEVTTKTGDNIIFNKKFPGKITPTGVFGMPQIQLPYSVVDSIVFNEKSLQSVWENGIQYEIISQDSLGYISHVPETLFIPLSEIEKMKVKAFNKKATTAATILAIMVPVTTVVLLIIGVHWWWGVMLS